MTVLWSSSNAAVVSNTGSVNRPSGNDSEVVLTASVNNGGKTASKEFKLKVIKARSRSIDDVKADTPENPFTPMTGDVIGTMNESDDAFNIVYDDNDEQIRHIDGKFSEMKIENADDPLMLRMNFMSLLGSLTHTLKHHRLMSQRTNKDDSNIPTSAWGYYNSWTDQHQISAYVNMRTVIKWWKDTFDRDSLDGKGMTVHLVTHASGWNDNACWNSGSQTISVGNIGDSSLYDLTRAIGLDTLTHETGHAVLYYVTGGIPYRNATGAIDDGYADIFGCLRDRDWRHGWRADNDGDPETGITYFKDKKSCLRDAREDISVKSLSDGAYSSYGLAGIKTIDELYEHYRTVTPQYYGNDGNGCHTYCRLVTGAA